MFSGVLDIHLQSLSKPRSRASSTPGTRTVASETVSLSSWRLHSSVDRRTINKEVNKPASYLQAVIGALKGTSRWNMTEGDPWWGGRDGGQERDPRR